MEQSPSSDRFARTELLLGPGTVKELKNASVTVLGLGAVGFTAVESLARTGIGAFRIADCDILRPSNTNRHLLADSAHMGTSKAETAKQRILGINPEASVEIFNLFVHEDTIAGLMEGGTGVVIDAIDSLAPKVAVLTWLVRNNIPAVSCMGAASRTDPFAVRIGDLSETRICPLALLVRKRLRKNGIEKDLTCVYSTEKPHPVKPGREGNEAEHYERGRTRTPLGSIFYITALFGLFASYAALDILTRGKIFRPSV